MQDTSETNPQNQRSQGNVRLTKRCLAEQYRSSASMQLLNLSSACESTAGRVNLKRVSCLGLLNLKSELHVVVLKCISLQTILVKDLGG